MNKRLNLLGKVILLTVLPGLVWAADSEKTSECEVECPPLPFHSIEGVGGGAITPIAYIVNPEQVDGKSKPSIAISNIIAGKKNLQAITITQAFDGRIEFGYGFQRLGLGDLPDDIEDATGIDIDRNQVYLHHFNLRGLLFEEDPQGWFPAITAGVHFKINDGIDSIDNKLSGALSGIGYERDYGVDYTLTASKKIEGAGLFGRPVILTGGLRNSSAAQIGLLGFGDDRTTTFEGSVVTCPADNVILAYEFRQKANPYDKIPGLVGDEDNWHAIDASLILDSQTTIVAGWGALGNLANGREDGAWWLQVKYEF
ncbi:MAG: DUF3034 family protein [Sedimentisphaeraceae bacterium JB056]